MTENEQEKWFASIEEDLAQDEARATQFREVLAQLGPEQQVQLSPEHYEMLTDRTPQPQRGATNELVQYLGMRALKTIKTKPTTFKKRTDKKMAPSEGINGSNASRAAYEANNVSAASSSKMETLDSDILLQLYTSQLDTANSDIKGKMSSMKNKSKCIEIANKYATRLADFKGAINDQNNNKDSLMAQRTGIISELDADIRAADANPNASPDEKKMLQDVRQAIDTRIAKGIPGDNVTSEDRAQWRTAFDNSIQATKDLAEVPRTDSGVLQMELQDLTQKRAQMNQLFSNVIASINESSKSIIQNTRLF